MMNKPVSSSFFNEKKKEGGGECNGGARNVM